jgi:menaquinol-cytochrome c reductase iron-sulfur subunit
LTFHRSYRLSFARCRWTFGGKMSRRKVLVGMIGVGGAAVVAALGGPAVIHAVSPNLNPDLSDHWVPLGALDDFEVGATRKAVLKVPRGDWSPSMRDKAVYVWRPSDQEVVVFSRACTDLGCPVEYEAGSRWFYCPCHGGIFDQEGQRRAGPPKRPLDRYRLRVREGILEIDLSSVPATV